MFEKIGSRRLLSHTIEEQIERAISERRLVPGQKLPTETELCTDFGVSRTVLREALRMLSARGLISIEKGRGMFVSALSAADVTDPMHLYLKTNLQSEYALDVIHARQAIEPAFAELAAQHRTQADIERLNTHLEELRQSRGDFGALAHLDMTFHRDIAIATQNPIMPLILDPIHRLMPEIKSSVYATVADAQDSALEWHGKIISAIIASDSARARFLMVEHLRIAELHVQQMLKAKSVVQHSH
jgi:GntR family transcriptional regulator, transcriptional repressor for pyruvate dehydrogenase complex